MYKTKYLKYIFLFLIFLGVEVSLLGQSAQIINPSGGAGLNDGLKVVVNPSGALSVYRNNQTQYYSGYTYPEGSGNGVTLRFRSSNTNGYSSSLNAWTPCSTTAAVQVGNVWTTSISGYFTSQLSNKRFYVTMNFKYTYPDKYFLVDYYVRAPHDLAIPETIHIYLDHDAFILGSDASKGYRNVNTTGEFVGDFRLATDVASNCTSNRAKNMVSPSSHGFKTKNGFRSYYTGPFSPRSNINAQLMLSNTVNNTCLDDGVAVEFIIGPLSAGKIGAKRVMHAYGDNKTEFDNIAMEDPTPPSGLSSPVIVNFTSNAFSENEGNSEHDATAIKITVSAGTLAQDQVCNFSVSGGTAIVNTDYSYVKGFIIPAGDYTTPKTLTLNNIKIIGNTICQDNRTFNISIDSDLCNDLIQPGTISNATYTIVDDDKPIVNQPVSQTYCKGISVPANTFVFSGSPVPNTTYTWVNNNTAIGLPASGTGNIPAFTAANNTNTAIVATITVTPKQGTCSGESKTFTITVNPTATVNAISNVTACNGSTVSAITFGSPTSGTTFSWTSSNTAIGLGASGNGNLPSFMATNTTSSAISSTITVTPTYGGCTGTSRTFTITVNPTATVNAISNVTACNGSTVGGITFGSPTSGTTFSWTSSNTAIGLGASGNGNLPSFTATNTTSSAISSTITVTPTYGGCTGTSRTFTITVNPTATVNAISNVTACNGSTVSAITFGSPTSGTTFSWTSSNTAIGLGASGNGNLPSFTATNTTSSAISSTITVTPTYGGCTGTSRTFTITVNPTATVNAIADQTVCNGTAMTAITFGTPTTPANKVTYSWTNDQPSIGISATGTASTIPAFTATNNGTAPVTASITVTPKYDNSCTGTPLTFKITVNPTATVNAIADQTVCNGTAMAAITFGTPTTPANKVTYSWTNDQPSIGISATGTTSTIPAFTATNNGAAPVTASITVTPKYDNSCTGTPLTFKITVYPQIIPGLIKGNPFVCQGMIPLPIKGDVSTGGSSPTNIKYQWQSSANGTSNWTDISGATAKDYTPVGSLSADTYFRRVTTDNYCNTIKHYSNVFLIKVVSLPTTLYWKITSTDNNWNNPDNWVDNVGNQLGMVPLACTDVVIRGGAAKYPSLDTSTLTEIYGNPVCRNITFEYASELAYQHKLKYEKAFVQYNWGYYTGTPANNSQPNNNGSSPSCAVKNRDVWYALAAPLKNMASGDFSLGGYPMTWQGGFNIAHPQTGETANVEAGDFSKVYAKNDINLVETNNAIAIKVALYNNTLGCNDHCNMNGLKGIMEFPYFENEEKAPFYPTHAYDKYSLESKFFYFDTKTLKLIYSPVGRMKRGTESYRFVYENSTNTAGTINLNGTTVLGYEQNVSKQIATSQKVMVGNPFMASINSKMFLDANNIDPANPKIKAVDGYYIFNSTLQTWENKPFSATNNIKPQQAFLVTLADGLNTTKLMYPLEGTYALTGPTFRGFSMVLPEGNSIYLKASSNIEKAGDYSVLNISDPEEGNNVSKLIYTEGHTVPETFFITSDGKEFNLIQAYENGVREVGVGVKCSDTENMISFTFENANEFYNATGLCPVLVDKVANVRQNLTKNKSYYFKQRAVSSDKKYVDADRFVLRLATPVEIVNSENLDISIVYHQGTLDISATDVIKEVLVYDLQGRLVHSNTKVGTITYTKILSLSQGVYIVKVHTENGNNKVERVMAL